ncbi:MAG: AAA domain-containing protein [Acidobacteriaceae bacterium]
MAISLQAYQAGSFAGHFGPSSAPEFIAIKDAFFDASGDPLGNFDPDALREVLGRAWDDASVKNWTSFVDEIDARCQAVFGGPLHEFVQIVFGQHRGRLRAHLIDESNLRDGQWAKVYDELLTGERRTGLLHAVLNGADQSRGVCIADSNRALFLGHMDARSSDGAGRSAANPLDPTQRLAAMQANNLDAEIMPINGPPGTGKTSFLRAVLASRWVLAAFEKAEAPPLVLGTGYTNKAVSNIIDAFGDVPGFDSNAISSRWLDGLPSYGWYFASQKAAQDFPDLMHLGYGSITKSGPFQPSGGAAPFSATSMEQHTQTYLNRAAASLDEPAANTPEWSVERVTETFHRRIASRVGNLREEQTRFARNLATVFTAWPEARALAAATKNASGIAAASALHAERLGATEAVLEHAIRQAGLFLREAEILTVSWRALLPERIHRWIYGRRMRDLALLEQEARRAFSSTQMTWHGALPAIREVIPAMRLRLDELRRQLLQVKNRGESATSDHISLSARRQRRRDTFESMRGMVLESSLPTSLKTSVPRLARDLCGSDKERAKHARDLLWHAFDAGQDLRLRVELFHLSARYWEGRWLLAQEGGKAVKNDAAQLRQLMMLGVVIVSTTHKLPDIGRRCAKVDLLIMDEAGQCPPEIAAPAIALAQSAILIGDTRQLQPITSLNIHQSEQFARRAGIDPSNLPPALCPARGSAMRVAQRATPITDDGPEPGVTLLFHYRCHPTIIGYCNELLYGGRMRIVRAAEATLSGMPAISWVCVDRSSPEKVGKSWANKAELEEIMRWLDDASARLVKAYGAPLAKIVAVITPLKAQATMAERMLKARFGDEAAGMTIGTIHALQGAERPVVLLSLVQDRSSGGNLYADHDGGHLMNVAVSRAKDALVVFSNRDTLRPGPADQALPSAEAAKPVGRLGSYLRRHGQRLYPRSLVIVEASGKTRAVEQALGLQACVVPTNGSLMQSSLMPNGSLAWEATSRKFVDAILPHRGLLDEIVIATDDDMAGELIGMHAAEMGVDALGETLAVRRMRFHAVTTDELRLAWQTAGTRFDADLLGAALYREIVRHLDYRRYQDALPGDLYVSAARRAILALVDASTHADVWHVGAEVEDGNGTVFQAFVPEATSTLAPPRSFSESDARKIADGLQEASLDSARHLRATQRPPLYPPSTTLRILEVAADVLGMTPWDAQDHLNAMYMEGSSP